MLDVRRAAAKLNWAGLEYSGGRTATHQPTSPRSTGFSAIWGCISSSSSSQAPCVLDVRRATAKLLLCVVVVMAWRAMPLWLLKLMAGWTATNGEREMGRETNQSNWTGLAWKKKPEKLHHGMVVSDLRKSLDFSSLASLDHSKPGSVRCTSPLQDVNSGA